jgi:hypothetical protein
MPTSVHTHIAYISDLRIAPKLKQSHPKPSANLISFYYPNLPTETKKNQHLYIDLVTRPWVFAKLSALIRLNPCHLCSNNKIESKPHHSLRANSEYRTLNAERKFPSKIIIFGIQKLSSRKL